jgi:hypothetical protein
VENSVGYVDSWQVLGLTMIPIIVPRIIPKKLENKQKRKRASGGGVTV